MSDDGGFDYKAYQQGKTDPDKALIVTFEYAPKKRVDGGFDNIEMTRIWLGRNDEVVRPTTDQDRVRFRDRYEAFKKGEAVPTEGTPISMCAFATPADVSACKAERIYTLEQIAEVPDERLQRAQLITFKYRAKDWLDAKNRHGFVGELRARIQYLEKENALLKEKLRDQGKDSTVVVPVETKRRGRPPKVNTDVNTQAAG